jgi:hypothetical protein
MTIIMADYGLKYGLLFPVQLDLHRALRTRSPMRSTDRSLSGHTQLQEDTAACSANAGHHQNRRTDALFTQTIEPSAHEQKKGLSVLVRET